MPKSAFTAEQTDFILSCLYAVPILFSHYMASLFFPDVFGLLVYFTNFNRQVSGALGKVLLISKCREPNISYWAICSLSQRNRSVVTYYIKNKDCHFFFHIISYFMKNTTSQNIFNPLLHNNTIWCLWNIMYLEILWKMEHLLLWSKCSRFHNIFKSFQNVT